MIQITFTPSTTAQGNVLAQAILSYLSVVDAGETVAEVVAEPKAEAPAAPKKARKPAAVEASASATGGAEVPNETAAAPSEPEAPAASTASSKEPSVSLEQVRAKLTELSQNGKGPEVKALIAKSGATKLTDIPAEKYAEVLAAAQEI